VSTVSSWQTALVASWTQVWTSFLTILPTVLGAIVVFALGLVIAFWAKRLVIEVLRVVKLEKLSESAGIEKYLDKAGVKMDLIHVLGKVFEWLVILVFFLAAVDILGLTVVSRVLVSVLGYVPNIIAAALIFGAGYFVAGLVGSLVRGALVSVDHDAAKPLGNLARWLILVVTFFAAVEQLQIARGLIATFFQGLTYTVVLVVGLSVGLGAKDLVAKILDDWYEKIKK
jgi:hypothetical protein